MHPLTLSAMEVQMRNGSMDIHRITQKKTITKVFGHCLDGLGGVKRSAKGKEKAEPEHEDDGDAAKLKLLLGLDDGSEAFDLFNKSYANVKAFVRYNIDAHPVERAIVEDQLYPIKGENPLRQLGPLVGASVAEYYAVCKYRHVLLKDIIGGAVRQELDDILSKSSNEVMIILPNGETDFGKRFKWLDGLESCVKDKEAVASSVAETSMKLAANQRHWKKAHLAAHLASTIFNSPLSKDKNGLVVTEIYEAVLHLVKVSNVLLNISGIS